MTAVARNTIQSLRPHAELYADKPCGTRGRYMAGCRCIPCRRANSAYENERQKARKNGDWNGNVPAAAARAHMKLLSENGVGRRAVSECTDISRTVLASIRNGSKTKIRARTEKKILAVSVQHAMDRALRPSKTSQEQIAELLEEGYTEEFLAKKLGYANPRLQFNFSTMTVRNIARVDRLYRELTT